MCGTPLPELTVWRKSTGGVTEKSTQHDRRNDRELSVLPWDLDSMHHHHCSFYCVHLLHAQVSNTWRDHDEEA